MVFQDCHNGRQESKQHGRSVTRATTAGYPKPLWHQAIKVIALLAVMLMCSLRMPWGSVWQKVLSLQPNLPAQPQDKLEDTSLDTRSHTLHSSARHQDALHKASHPGSGLQSTLPAPALQLLCREDFFNRNKPHCLLLFKGLLG